MGTQFCTIMVATQWKPWLSFWCHQKANIRGFEWNVSTAIVPEVSWHKNYSWSDAARGSEISHLWPKVIDSLRKHCRFPSNHCWLVTGPRATRKSHVNERLEDQVLSWCKHCLLAALHCISFLWGWNIIAVCRNFDLFQPDRWLSGQPKHYGTTGCVPQWAAVQSDGKKWHGDDWWKGLDRKKYNENYQPAKKCNYHVFDAVGSNGLHGWSHVYRFMCVHLFPEIKVDIAFHNQNNGIMEYILFLLLFSVTEEHQRF